MAGADRLAGNRRHLREAVGWSEEELAGHGGRTQAEVYRVGGGQRGKGGGAGWVGRGLSVPPLPGRVSHHISAPNRPAQSEAPGADDATGDGEAWTMAATLPRLRP